jgi:hypothetical protein
VGGAIIVISALVGIPVAVIQIVDRLNHGAVVTAGDDTKPIKISKPDGDINLCLTVEVKAEPRAGSQVWIAFHETTDTQYYFRPTEVTGDKWRTEPFEIGENNGQKSQFWVAAFYLPDDMTQFFGGMGPPSQWTASELPPGASGTDSETVTRSGDTTTC